MINFLDDVLQQLFITTVDVITSPSQVSFEPPDDDFRTQVKSGNKLMLNVYLVDLRENRVLRSNERVRDFQNGMITETPAPRRVDCHYLISAWSPAAAAADPTPDEHSLLYKATAALVDAEPFVASQIYGATPLPANFPDIIKDTQLPSVILPVEGFPKLAEFWGATKTVHWKPAVYLIVTLPVVMTTLIAGPPVTTRFAEYQFTGSTLAPEILIQIGGSVVTGGAPPQVVMGAWVRIEDAAGRPIIVTTTDANGHFTFANLLQGTFTLRVRAQGFAEATRTIQVPSISGNYDVQLV